MSMKDNTPEPSGTFIVTAKESEDSLEYTKASLAEATHLPRMNIS